MDSLKIDSRSEKYVHRETSLKSGESDSRSEKYVHRETSLKSGESEH